MARVLKCDYSLEVAELAHTSEDAKNLVRSAPAPTKFPSKLSCRSLLVADPSARLSASQSLAQPWLSGEHIYIGRSTDQLSVKSPFSRNRPLGRFFLVVAMSVYMSICPLFM